VVHTADVPPNHGSICFAMIGCTKKSRKLDIKIVIANRFLFNIFLSKKLILCNYQLNHIAAKFRGNIGDQFFLTLLGLKEK
jgi:hypothetical protein